MVPTELTFEEACLNDAKDFFGKLSCYPAFRIVFPFITLLIISSALFVLIYISYKKANKLKNNPNK